MSTDDDAVVGNEAENDDVVSHETAVAEDVQSNVESELEDPAEHRMSLDVQIEDAGPCKKHVRVKIPRPDIDYYNGVVLDELAISVDVPGFRKGRVPKKLVGRRFRREIADEVKQKLLIGSLEQLAEDADIDPINEPDLDVETIEIPEEGDFEYEFNVEVRPTFELPDYSQFEIERPTREVTDEDIEGYLHEFLAQYATVETRDGAAEKGDSVVCSVVFTHEGKVIRELHELSARLLPTLRFPDGELTGFDDLMQGASIGDQRTTDITISVDAEALELRGETVTVEFTVKKVNELRFPTLGKDFLERVGIATEEALRQQIRDTLERQVVYQQRQATRQQVLDKITESADWDLPEELVAKQTENALRREILEMQQAGFTTPEIRARENELRQHAIATTTQAMKEHFVLDKVAEDNDIEVSAMDINNELTVMAIQSGENPRRLRARLTKSGMMENLEAQIRERKAVDFILSKATFKDVPLDDFFEAGVEAVDQSICQSIVDVEVREPAEASDEVAAAE